MGAQVKELHYLGRIMKIDKYNLRSWVLLTEDVVDAAPCMASKSTWTVRVLFRFVVPDCSLQGEHCPDHTISVSYLLYSPDDSQW